jgi:hypothetical protein
MGPEASPVHRLDLPTTSKSRVIGAGQAGLAIGCYLRRQVRRFVIWSVPVEIASPWRERWDSLTLFTLRRYSGLPGLPFPGDPEGYPMRDEVIGYLERYAETFELILGAALHFLAKHAYNFRVYEAVMERSRDTLNLPYVSMRQVVGSPIPHKESEAEQTRIAAIRESFPDHARRQQSVKV